MHPHHVSDEHPHHHRDDERGQAESSRAVLVDEDRQPGPSTPSETPTGGHRSLSFHPSTLLTTTTMSSADDGASPPTPTAMAATAAESCLRMLHCPCCDPPALLDRPTTLRCGHSVCSRHLEGLSPLPSTVTDSALAALLPCPVPSCREFSGDGRSPTSEQPLATTVPVSSIEVPHQHGSEPPSFGDSLYSGRDVTLVRCISSCVRVLGRENSDVIAQQGSDGGSDDDTDAGSDRSAQRPQKRRRRGRSSGDSGRVSDRLDSFEQFEKEMMENLTCEICFMLLYEPVTIPCQHTFCTRCLQRSLDHALRCPLCRRQQPSYTYFQDHPQNKAILSIIRRFFPDTYTERGRVLTEEERKARLDTPIFVCQLSLPNMPTNLHFFEPRYRLMLRRCLEMDVPCFGMVLPPSPSSGLAGTAGHDYGTMLRIRNVRMFSDGRSLVETVGSHRFRILDRGVLDGYMVGKVERIDDIPEALEIEAQQLLLSTAAGSGSTPAEPTIEELFQICRVFVEQVSRGAAPWIVDRLNNTYGPMPTNANDFSFWMALILPIDEHEKAKLLPMRSPYLRLRLICHWIQQLNASW